MSKREPSLEPPTPESAFELRLPRDPGFVTVPPSTEPDEPPTFPVSELEKRARALDSVVRTTEAPAEGDISVTIGSTLLSTPSELPQRAERTPPAAINKAKSEKSPLLSTARSALTPHQPPSFSTLLSAPTPENRWDVEVIERLRVLRLELTAKSEQLDAALARIAALEAAANRDRLLAFATALGVVAATVLALLALTR